MSATPCADDLAELAVLGGILFLPDRFAAVRDHLGPAPARLFTRQRHAAIWTAMADLHVSGQGIDLSRLQNRLADSGSRTDAEATEFLPNMMDHGARSESDLMVAARERGSLSPRAGSWAPSCARWFRPAAPAGPGFSGWVAPPFRDPEAKALEDRLWEAVDELRANSGLTSAQYAAPVLGLIFLRFADIRFQAKRKELEAGAGSSRRGSQLDAVSAYHAAGVIWLPETARWRRLLELPAGDGVGAQVNEAMAAIEEANPQLAGTLPRSYQAFDGLLLQNLLRTFAGIPADLGFDAFGRIYEYFLGEFAMSEGQGGGEFYTPSSIVKLLVEVIEPYGISSSVSMDCVSSTCEVAYSFLT